MLPAAIAGSISCGRKLTSVTSAGVSPAAFSNVEV